MQVEASYRGSMPQMSTPQMLMPQMLAVLCAVAICGVGCLGSAPILDSVVECDCGALSPVHFSGGVYLTGQPTLEDLQLLQEQGIRTVVNLRLPDEVTHFDEPQEAANLGMAYHNVGFKGEAMLSDEVFDEVRRLLLAADSKPLLLHCGSGNRVGAVWVAYRVLDQGQSLEAAMGEAKGIGLRTPAYETRARQYIAARMTQPRE